VSSYKLPFVCISHITLNTPNVSPRTHSVILEHSPFSTIVTHPECRELSCPSHCSPRIYVYVLFNLSSRYFLFVFHVLTSWRLTVVSVVSLSSLDSVHPFVLTHTQTRQRDTLNLNCSLLQLPYPNPTYTSTRPLFMYLLYDPWSPMCNICRQLSLC
jgi:hypothetical protein